MSPEKNGVGSSLHFSHEVPKIPWFSHNTATFESTSWDSIGLLLVSTDFSNKSLLLQGDPKQTVIFEKNTTLLWVNLGKRWN